ncbi:hypothetical protein EDS67_06560 [candidate division KSB1 bacterium]|nr:MAG: hypothetical protein EDS67_06560 [candidate division KSB1 bacterium]MBC6947165.1 hypothetical protein [candidate division KSB1 bacterium]MCE7941250.1 hypothetical protein [Chlorobi bacterium CHB1]MDL1875178.1 type I restriction enzyme HsdR N-terminal domain-containing protein [Cytophagia bacterium CHB2]
MLLIPEGEMPPKPYYDINPEAYIFVKKKESISPEEKVRQWAIFELLSTYRININNINIEIPIKVGRKYHYADIIVYRNHLPCIVIECKRQDDDDLNSGIDQAVSYATASEIRASYAVLTNGKEWIVKRRINQGWCLVPDIEYEADKLELVEASSALDVIDKVRAILHWIYRQVPADQAGHFLFALHDIMLCKRFLFKEVNDDLWLGTELFIRPIAGKFWGKDEPYTRQNVDPAYDNFISYFDRFGIVDDQARSAIGLESKITIIKLRLEELVKNTQGMTHVEVSFIRVAFFIAEYLEQSLKFEQYSDIPEGIVNEIVELVRPFWETKLGMRLPDRLDKDAIDAIHAWCPWNPR